MGGRPFIMMGLRQTSPDYLAPTCAYIIYTPLFASVRFEIANRLWPIWFTNMSSIAMFRLTCATQWLTSLLLAFLSKIRKFVCRQARVETQFHWTWVDWEDIFTRFLRDFIYTFSILFPTSKNNLSTQVIWTMEKQKCANYMTRFSSRKKCLRFIQFQLIITGQVDYIYANVIWQTNVKVS